MIMAVAWTKKYKLVLENKRGKLVWDFKFHLRKTTTTTRPDLTLEVKAKTKIWICDMGCPQQRNIEAKRLEKLTKYRQLAYISRGRHSEYEIMVVTQVIRAISGGIRQTMVHIGKNFESKDLSKRKICKIQKTVLMDSESFSRDLFKRWMNNGLS